MTTGSVLDILIYVFDRYMLDEAPEVPARAHLERDLRAAGFAARNVERALDWLTALACARGGDPAATGADRAGLRVFSDSELTRLSTEARGMLLRLGTAGVLDAQQRELVIDRLLALDTDEPDTEQLKWVTLMVLSSQPGQEQAVERLGGLVWDAPRNAPH